MADRAAVRRPAMGGRVRELRALVVVTLAASWALVPAAVADDSPLYFSSPADAVAVVTALLRNEDWPTLARYYDLSGSSVSKDALVSGRWFVREERPAMAHPGLPWRFRHPFTPGFTFFGTRAGDRPDITVVMVGIDIDEGGGRVRRGRSEFDLRRSAAGYRLIASKQGDRPAADLAALRSVVGALVHKYYPGATVTRADQSLHFEFDTRIFMVHELSRRGERWQDAHEERGPQPGGIHGQLDLRQGRSDGAALVPQ